MVYPRTQTELAGAGALADWNDYDAIAQAVRGLLHVQMFEAVVPENEDHVHVTHNLGSVPTAVVLAPVDDVGRCWYDMLTISTTIIDVYVANPPQAGGYMIKVLLYY
jgi:hypothetical protein